MYSSSALYNVILTSNVYYLEHFSSLLFSFFIKYIFRIGISSVRNKKKFQSCSATVKDEGKEGRQYWSALLSFVVNYRRAIVCLGCECLTNIITTRIIAGFCLSSRRNGVLWKHIIHIRAVILRRYFHCKRNFHSTANCSSHRTVRARGSPRSSA